MKVGSSLPHVGWYGYNLTQATVMDIDDGEGAAASTSAPRSKGASRVQKWGRGKASSSMVFPVYKKGKRVGARKKLRR